MQNPRTATSRHVVVDDEVVGRALEVPDLDLVLEVLDLVEARRRVEVVAVVDVRERLGRAHREPVGREPPAQVVEQRADAHDVGVEHEPDRRQAVGPGVDRVDRAQPPSPRRVMRSTSASNGPFYKCSHGR